MLARRLRPFCVARYRPELGPSGPVRRKEPVDNVDIGEWAQKTHVFHRVTPAFIETSWERAEGGGLGRERRVESSLNWRRGRRVTEVIRERPLSALQRRRRHDRRSHTPKGAPHRRNPPPGPATRPPHHGGRALAAFLGRLVRPYLRRCGRDRARALCGSASHPVQDARPVQNAHSSKDGTTLPSQRP